MKSIRRIIYFCCAIFWSTYTITEIVVYILYQKSRDKLSSENNSFFIFSIHLYQFN